MGNFEIVKIAQLCTAVLHHADVAFRKSSLLVTPLHGTVMNLCLSHSVSLKADRTSA